MTTQRTSNRVAACATTAQLAATAQVFPPGLITFLANIAENHLDAFDVHEEQHLRAFERESRDGRWGSTPANDNGQPAPPPFRCTPRRTVLPRCGSALLDRVGLRRAS